MRHGSLFSGIGGFDLAASWLGWDNLFQVELDPFCNQVLQRHFPNTARYGDIREFDGTRYRGLIDVLSGGFPCQPFSYQGLRKGEADPRFLWPEMFRVIQEIEPAYVIGENVEGLTSKPEFERVCRDLEAAGYAVEPHVVGAAAVGARHRRNRVWLLAHARDDRRGQDLPERDEQNSPPTRLVGREAVRVWESPPPPECSLCRVADGLPEGLDRNRKLRIKALGNAIVPQVAYAIFTAVEAHARLRAAEPALS